MFTLHRTNARIAFTVIAPVDVNTGYLAVISDNLLDSRFTPTIGSMIQFMFPMSHHGSRSNHRLAVCSFSGDQTIAIRVCAQGGGPIGWPFFRTFQ